MEEVICTQDKPVTILAFYSFINLNDEELADAKKRLYACAELNNVRGLIVIGNEGINATVSVDTASEEIFKQTVLEIAKVPLAFKYSSAPKHPFNRFKIDERPEIITTHDEKGHEIADAGTHLTPKEWHDLLSSNDPDVVLVDTRNDYETGIGMFSGAIDPQIKKFSDFSDYVQNSGIPKEKKLLLYCTGGIRCEKAVADVKRQGYDKVYQLSGGILKYLEEFPNGHFAGECFVFDHRVSVDQELSPSKTYRLCPHCGNPGKERMDCENCGKQTVICTNCLEQPRRHTCSKNCAHHYDLKRAKAGER